MRLFTAFALPPDVLDRLSLLLAELRPLAEINWSPVTNLHITTKFIGEWKEERLDEMKAALANVAAAGYIRIAIGGFGYFPNPHRPHSFFAEVHSGPELPELAAATDRALSELGCADETKPYRPHVTLARIKPSRDIGSLRDHIAQTKNFDFGEFDCQVFHLYRSAHEHGRSVYSRLATYDLMREKHNIS